MTNVRADTIGRELTAIFFRHSYIPCTILSDLGTSFVSELMHELAKLLEVKLKHASLKHPQTVGVVERSHGALKRILKLNMNDQWNDCYKYVHLATFIHNTSDHSAIGCSPTVLFHGREPIKPLDVHFNNRMIERFSPNSEYVFALQDAMKKKFSDTQQKLTDMYNKHRTYYDYKAEAKPLSLFSYCLLLNPKLMTQSDFASKSLPIWLPLYRIEKNLTNSNYIIREVGTNYTQCVHRIRLRPITPQSRIDDIPVIAFENFQRDPSLGQFRGEPELFDESLPSILEAPPQLISTPVVEDDPPPVTVSLHFPIAPAAAPAPGPVVPPVPAPAVAVGGPRPLLVQDPPNTPISSEDSEGEISVRTDLSDNNLETSSPPQTPDPPVQVESANTQPLTRNLRPRLHPVQYSETRFKSEATIPHRERYLPSSSIMREPPTTTQEQKRQSVLESLERTRETMGLSSSHQSGPSQSMTSPRPLTQPTQAETPPEYLRRQKEIKSRYSLKNFKKRLMLIMM